jgi:hypothetical protein
MLILQILQWGPMHGLAIAQTIRTKYADLLKIEAGSLYHRAASTRAAGLAGRRLEDI